MFTSYPKPNIAEALEQSFTMRSLIGHPVAPGDVRAVLLLFHPHYGTKDHVDSLVSLNRERYGENIVSLDTMRTQVQQLEKEVKVCLASRRSPHRVDASLDYYASDPAESEMST